MENLNTTVVKEIMENKGLSQKELASLTGLTEAAISHYLSGRRNPNPANLLKIATALDVNPGSLVSVRIGEENKQEICDALLPVLRMTRNLSDLSKLEYIKDNDHEWVRAVFETGNSKWANVAMDSGTSLIKDILNQIV